MSLSDRISCQAREKIKQNDVQMKTPQTQIRFGTTLTDVPKGQSKIVQRFIAGSPAAPGQVPKGRLKKGGGGVQSSLRDSNWIDSTPGVETPGYYRDVPSGRRSSNRWPE